MGKVFLQLMKISIEFDALLYNSLVNLPIK